MTVRHRLALARAHDLTLGTLLERVAEIHGDRPLVEEPDGLRLTAREAADRVDRWAGAMAGRCQPGERVVVALPNGYGQLLACLAVSRAGAIPVPINPRMSDDEVDHVLADSGAHVILRDAGELAGSSGLGKAVPASPNDLAALFYTSGTTGRPKGAQLTHRSLVGSLGGGALWPGRLRRDEVVLGLPIAHIMGFAALLGMAVAGIPVYLFPTFDPVAVLDAIEQRRATMFMGVPTMYRMLLEAGAESRDLRSVRVWGSGADAMPADLSRRFQRMGASLRLPVSGRNVGQAAFVEGWGMVETGGGAIGRLSPPGFALPLVDGYGFALPGYKLKIVSDGGAEVAVGEVGELLVRGPGVLTGYHGDADATAAALTSDGYLRTGDLVRRGRLGTVAFAGRKKDVVKSGGYSVFSAEVERALEEHPDVLEAAVVGLDDDRLGQVPGAAVRLRPGAVFDADALDAHAAERLASYKLPRRIIAVDELPRGGTGKVQKDRLRSSFDP